MTGQGYESSGRTAAEMTAPPSGEGAGGWLPTYPYEVTISRPRWRYRIQINHGLVTIGRGFMGADIGWWAWTRAGAERKATRIMAPEGHTDRIIARYEVGL